MNKIKKCLACGKEYSYNRLYNKELYATTFCSKNCNGLFALASEIAMKTLSADDVNKTIESLDISEIDSFNSEVKDMIKSVMKPKRSKKSAKVEKEVEEVPVAVAEEEMNNVDE